MPEKNYTAEEVSALLGRAARLQAADADAERHTLTLPEVKTAAAEAGIDGRYVEMAASATSEYGAAAWTVPTEAGRSMSVPGALDDARWHRLATLFALTFGGPGETTHDGARRTWTQGGVSVTAEPSGGHDVVLHARAAWGGELEMPLAFAIVGAVAAAVSGALAVVAMEWTIGLVAALLAAAVVGSFAAYRGRMARRQARLRAAFAEVLDRSAHIVAVNAADGKDEALPSAATPSRAAS